MKEPAAPLFQKRGGVSKQPMITFHIPGNPVPKARSRSYRTANGVRHVTPDQTVRYERLVSHVAGAAMGLRSPLIGPVGVFMVVSLSIPSSWSKTRQRAAIDGKTWMTSKPDLDNIVKSVKDGMNCIAWLDDSQVVELRASKAYGEVPGVNVTFWEMDEVQA